MPTLKQLEANRRNALKSTGPRTPGGKAASSTNALKTRIADFYEIHQPAAADERSLVDTLIVNEWTLRRLRKAECQIWDTSIQSSLEKNWCTAANGLEDAFARHNQRFTVLRRQIASCERSAHHALRDLEFLKKLRCSEPPPQPAESEPETPKLASFHQKTSPDSDPPAAAPPLSPDPELVT